MFHKSQMKQQSDDQKTWTCTNDKFVCIFLFRAKSD